MDEAALASDRPRDLATLDLRFLGALANQLTASDRVWTVKPGWVEHSVQVVLPD